MLSSPHKEESTIEDKSLTHDLNILLASYQVNSHNLHGYHWNIESPFFFPLHKQLGKYYDGANDKIDIIAERIRQLDSFPFHTMSDFVKHSKLNEEKDIKGCMDIADKIINTIETLVPMMKAIEKKAVSDGDVVTSDIMIEMIRAEEKDLWMMKSFKKGLDHHMK